jgi:hypothetical protein
MQVFGLFLVQWFGYLDMCGSVGVLCSCCYSVLCDGCRDSVWVVVMGLGGDGIGWCGELGGVEDWVVVREFWVRVFGVGVFGVGVFGLSGIFRSAEWGVWG